MSTAFTTTDGEEHTLTLLKDILVLCFNKIHWFFLTLGVLGFIGIGTVLSLNYVLFDGVVEVLKTCMHL